MHHAAQPSEAFMIGTPANELLGMQIAVLADEDMPICMIVDGCRCTIR